MIFYDELADAISSGGTLVSFLDPICTLSVLIIFGVGGYRSQSELDLILHMLHGEETQNCPRTRLIPAVRHLC